MIVEKLAIKLAENARTASRISASMADKWPNVLRDKLINMDVSQRSEALKIISIMQKEGVLNDSHTLITLYKSAEWFKQLSDILLGIDIARTELEPESAAEVVLTNPRSPSKLDSRLRSKGPSVVRILETKSAFQDLASSVKRRFVVMTPFLDRQGADWLRDLFTLVSDEAEKILILRFLKEDPTSPRYPDGYEAISQFLSERNISVYDFTLDRPGEGFKETFHSKCIIADDTVAYVGSSNINKHSLSNSMELGFLVRGNPVKCLNMVVNSVLEISNKQ